MSEASAMPVVGILAGGMGTRLGDETVNRPKPMVEIGGRPILWHIMRWYGYFGFTEFALALGYKADVVKDWFLNYVPRNSDLTIELATGATTVHDGERPDWRIHMIDTGLRTETGGRLRRLAPWLGSGTFMATYGDGLADVDPRRLLDYHLSHGKLATVTAVRPPARFGALELTGDYVRAFSEKPQSGEGWINGGFFVFEPGALEFIEGDETVLEKRPLESLAQAGELAAYRHDGFFQPMDTPRDRQLLENLWKQGRPPWVVGR
jgi:glucose-1-phosphate cytidylyltransferase